MQFAMTDGITFPALGLGGGGGWQEDNPEGHHSGFIYLKVLGKSIGLCKNTNRKDHL